MEELSLTVRDITGVDTLRPVTGGVPIAEGAAPAASVFALRGEEGKHIPLQTSVLARWKDGSARWVLLDFQAAPPALGMQGYVLTWKGRAAAQSAATCTSSKDGQTIGSGTVALSAGDGALLRVSERFDLTLSLTDAEGTVCSAVADATEIETAGDLRSTMALAGTFRTPQGDCVFQFRLRASVYAGLSRVRIEPLILVDADAGIIQRVRELRLSLKPRHGVRSIRLGGDPGWEGAPGPPVRLFQRDDEHYRIECTEAQGTKAPGWAEINDGAGTAAVALRDFWQQWPKSLEASPDGLAIGLLPRFEAGEFDGLEPWYKHDYFFEGDTYRLRTGQARRWDIWVDLSGDGPSLAKAADAPLVPAADPAQAIATGVWDSIEPAGIPETAEYDPWAENLFDAYCHSIQVQRDYGAMNWGDWFGERKVNWGNHEYDTTNQLLIQFARTGDPRYFYVAAAAARHSAEVDTIHHVNDDLARYFTENFGSPSYPPRAGMVHEHAVGHVGSFHPVETIRKLYVESGIGHGSDKPYLCLDPYNLGHIWTQGIVRQYFLTGDPFLKEAVEKIGSNLAKLAEDGEYKFIGHSHCGRTAGWSMLAMAGAYELDFDERYLRSMKSIVDAAIEEQDPNCGGWLYKLPPGHCFCEKEKHTGMATFITGILINGLSRYYFLTGDDRLPEVVDRAVTFVNNDTWRENLKGWRYTSCPGHTAASQPGVVMMAYVNAVRMADNPEHLRILRLAWDEKFQGLRDAPPPGPGFGKSYTAQMYGCAETVGLLAGRGRA